MGWKICSILWLINYIYCGWKADKEKNSSLRRPESLIAGALFLIVAALFEIKECL